MKNIIVSAVRPYPKPHYSLSLTGKLEAVIGKYFVSGEGIPDRSIFTVYYSEKTAHDECVELVPDNIIAYVTSDYKFAFVLEKMLNKFISDTAEYSLSYLPVKDFMKEEFCIQTTEQTPGFFKRIVWINDDFLYDVKQDFDFNTFRLIDDGIKYLNPGHFTIYELVSYINSAEQSELMVTSKNLM